MEQDIFPYRTGSASSSRSPLPSTGSSFSIPSFTSHRIGSLLQYDHPSHPLPPSSFSMPPETPPPGTPTTTQPRPFTSSSYHHVRSTTADGSLGKYICAVLEYRGVGHEIGVACFEKETGACSITQFADTPTYVKTIHHLSLHPPSTIIVPETATHSATSRMKRLRLDTVKGSGASDIEPSTYSIPQESMLVRCLEEIFEIQVTPYARKHWNHQQGAEYLERLLIHDSDVQESDSSESINSTTRGELGDTSNRSATNKSRFSSEMHAEASTRAAILVAASTRYYALSACAALFKYIEQITIRTFGPNSLRIRFVVPDGTILISSNTAYDLELVNNLVDRKSNASLFGLMDHCVTPMGKRLLKTNLLQPMTDLGTIESRLDAVEECMASEEQFYAIKESLNTLKEGKVELDKLIYWFVYKEKKASEPKNTEAKIAHLLELRTLIRAVTPAREALQGSSSMLLSSIRMFMESPQLNMINDAVESTLNEDIIHAKTGLSSRNARVYAVKANRSPLLDVARETYRENLEDIMQLCERYSREQDLPLVPKVSPNGFLLQSRIDSSRIRRLPREFTNVVKAKNGRAVTMLTLDLKKLNARLMDSLNEIFLLSDKIIDDVLNVVVYNIGALYRVSEAIALLDMVTSFAKLAALHNYTRPRFGDKLFVRNARHPILERFKDTNDLVPNDVFLPENDSFCLITGPNMSGKSTYLRQVALLTIMATVGSFVPAEDAQIRIPDAILCRLSNNEDAEAGLSTFANEMRTTAFILSLVQRRSLVLLDELGRATSPEEGAALALAVSEELLHVGATTFFATHFAELAPALTLHRGVSLQCFKASFGDNHFVLHHKLRIGQAEDNHFGLTLANLTSLPPSLLSRATSFAETLETQYSHRPPLTIRRTLIRKLCNDLETVLTGSNTEMKKDTLINMQSTFVDAIAETLTNEEEEEINQMNE